jgi:hypothetical protein
MNRIAAPLYGISIAVTVALLLGMAHGSLTGAIAAASLAIGAAICALAFVSADREPGSWRRISAWGWGTILLFALFSLRAFLWLIFRDRDAIAVLSPNNTGDMSLHLTYINYFASGAPFWPANPIHAYAPLGYPIGIDLFNSLLTLTGVDTIRGLVWVGLAGCALTGAALWKWGGAFTMLGFLCNGGLLGFAFFSRWRFLDYQSEAAWPDNFPEIGWKSIPLALFVTQRGFLFALPAGLLLLTSWRRRYFEADREKRPLPWLGEWLLYVSLPLFHLHTFLFLSLLLAAWFFVHRPARMRLALFVAASLVPASALVYLVTGGFSGASVIGLQLGWMQGSQNFFVFWVSNFGVLPFLVILLALVLLRDLRNPWPAAVVLPAIGIFLLCCLVRFAPWEWDNTKLMIWSYLAILPALWREVIAQFAMFPRALICVLLFFSGFVSLIGGLDATHVGYPIATRSELDGVASALRSIPGSDRFIGHPTYNHPLLLLGRPMALGYTGHAWSHGLEWRDTLHKVETVLDGDEAWRAAAKSLNCRYLFWGREERENYPDSQQPWKSENALVAAGDWGEIYDLWTPITPAIEPVFNPLNPAEEPASASPR